MAHHLIQHEAKTEVVTKPWKDDSANRTQNALGATVVTVNPSESDEKTCDSTATAIISDGASDRRYLVCEEMYRNECHLIEKLRLLLAVRDGLLDRVAQKRPLLKNEQITQIFGKIERQLRFHEKIYEKLVKIIENWDGSVCDVIKVWTETFDEHRRVYSSYANYYDSAKAMLENACAKDARLEKFLADYEKNKLFGRKRVVEIMFEPVQYVPGLKNIVERLEKVDREHGSQSPIGEAIVTIEKILSYSNSVRFNNDEGMKKLILTKEIEDLPPDLLKASNSIHGLLEVKWICAEKKLNVGKDDTVKLILFSDSTILICKQKRTFGENTWLGKTVVTRTLLGSKKQQFSYKFIMALQAHQFRSVCFIYNSPLKEETSEPKRTSICCWEIRDSFGDSTWCVEAEYKQMDEFVKLLEDLIKKKSNDRSLHFNTKMNVTDVPHVCGRVLKKELKKGRFEPTKDDDQKKAEEPQE